MSIRWMDYVWRKTDYREGEALVALALADFANDEGHCFPKMEQIAQKARLSVRQVQRIIRSLEADGLLEVTRQAGRGKRPGFTLKKVTSTSPFSDRKKVTSVSPFTEIKGDIHDIKKVTSVSPFPPTPPYKEYVLNTKPSVEPSEKKEEAAPPPFSREQEERPRITFYSVSKPSVPPSLLFSGQFPSVGLAAADRRAVDDLVLDNRLWLEVMQEWQSSGWNPANVGGMLDRYRTEAIKHGEYDDRRMIIHRLQSLTASAANQGGNHGI